MIVVFPIIIFFNNKYMGAFTLDSFEIIVSELLEEDGYWVRCLEKINLTKEEKRKLGKPSMPRPEIDIIALSLSQNTIYLLEVKSFLDSNGVNFEDVVAKGDIFEGRYKLLTSEVYRNSIRQRLQLDWISKGIINSETIISFGLVAGNVYKKREKELEAYFQSKDWFFWGPSQIKERILNLSNKGYENNIMVITSKILSR